MKSLRKLLNKREGQGTTEYIVILAIVVGIAIAVVKTGLVQHLTTSLNQLGTKVETETK